MAVLTNKTQVVLKDGGSGGTTSKSGPTLSSTSGKALAGKTGTVQTTTTTPTAKTATTTSTQKTTPAVTKTTTTSGNQPVSNVAAVGRDLGVKNETINSVDDMVNALTSTPTQQTNTQTINPNDPKTSAYWDNVQAQNQASTQKVADFFTNLTSGKGNNPVDSAVDTLVGGTVNNGGANNTPQDITTKYPLSDTLLKGSVIERINNGSELKTAGNTNGGTKPATDKGTPITITRADGSTVQGYIEGGKTIVDGGLKEGDKIPTNGGNYYFHNGEGITEAAWNALNSKASGNETNGGNLKGGNAGIIPTYNNNVNESVNPTTDQGNSQGSTSDGVKPVTITRADGSTVQGYIKDGHTYVDGGLKDGDRVPTGGGEYIYSNGRGIPTYTDANGNTFAYDPNDTDTLLRVDVGGYIPSTITPSQLASLPEGSKVIGVVEGYSPTDLNLYNNDPQAALEQSSNGTVTQDFTGNKGATYNLDGGNVNILNQATAQFESMLPDSAVVNGNGTLNLSNCTPEEVLQIVYNAINSNSPEMDDFLSWAEAYAMSYETLGESYDAETETMLNNLMSKALTTGFYGQLPYEQIKANALSSAEVEKFKAIASYARELRESDADTAISKYKALIDGMQVTNDDLMDFAELYYSYLQDKTAREDQLRAGEAGSQPQYASASALFSMANSTKDPASYIAKYYADFGFTNASEAVDAYNQYLSGGNSSSAGVAPGNGSGNGSGKGGGSGSKGYDNGGYTPDQVKALQNALGVTADGYYGPKTRAAAGDVDIDTAMRNFNNSQNPPASDKTTPVLGLDNSALSSTSKDDMRKELLSRIFATTMGTTAEKRAATNELYEYLDYIYPQVSPDFQQEIKDLLALNGYGI